MSLSSSSSLSNGLSFSGLTVVTVVVVVVVVVLDVIIGGRISHFFPW